MPIDMRISRKESGINKAKESRKRVKAAKAKDPQALSEAEAIAKTRYDKSIRGKEI